MQPRIHRSTKPFPGPPPPGVPQRIDDDVEPRRRIKTNPGSKRNEGTPHTETQAWMRSDSGPLRPGDRVGRYVVRNKLGRGGMGVVWGAYDPVLGRRVALKLVRQRDAIDAPSVEANVDERLRREAQALARLSHPNVVSLYDVGACEHGDYLAMELVPGVDLEQWLHKTMRSWKQILEVFLLAGRGLAAAHTAGLIHRDFKPANVIVGPQGHVTVVDFGLARSAELDTTLGDQLNPGDRPHDPDAPFEPRSSTDSTALLSTRLTGTNMIVGTRGYMSPEQLLGFSVGPRADQFSFCVALWEAFYGARPYPGTNAVETATSFARGELVEPSDRRSVPRRVHEVLLRGLKIEADDRYPSMDALLVALRQGMPAKRKRLLAAAALLVIAALSSTGGAWVQRMLIEAEAEQEPAAAREPAAERAEHDESSRVTPR